jgi:poly(hydroxyalkanoate) granule-associated protein
MSGKKDKKVQDDLRESAHKIWLAGLGALAVAKEEGSKAFKRLVEKGEKFEARSRGKVDKAKKKAKKEAETTWKQVEDSLEEKIADALHKVGVPTRNELASLTKQVGQLSAKVEKLKPEAKAAPKSKTAAKSKA